MTTEQIKEQLSIHYLGALASRAGHILRTPTGIPTNVDAYIAEIRNINFGNKTRLTEIGNNIDLQLKCTSTQPVVNSNKQLVFDIEAKNYNDMVFRRILSAQSEINPLVLIVLILPNEEDKWLKLTLNENLPEGILSLGGIAYWYFLNEDLPLSANKKWKRLYIPLQNRVDLNFVGNIFKLIKY